MLNFGNLPVMVRTVFGEARGEPYEGKLAVAHVILNRARRPGWWGKSIGKVCLKKWQFSCWLPGDPNRRVIENADLDIPLMRECLKACLEAAAGAPDPTGGAAHYYATSMPTPPKWAKGKTPDVVIGRHAFYRNVA